MRSLREGDSVILAAATLGNVNWSGPRFTAEQISQIPEIVHYFSPCPPDREFGVVIEDAEGAGIAVAWARYFTLSDPGYGFVDEDTPELSVWVDQSHRSKGHGTRLLDVLISEAQNAGIWQLSLSVEAGNPAMRLYKRLGFVRVEGAENDGTFVLVL